MKTKIFYTFLFGFLLLFFARNNGFWGPSTFANELRFVSLLLMLTRFVLLAMTAGTVLVLAQGIRQKRLGIGFVPLLGIAAAGVFLFVRILSTIPQLNDLGENLGICHRNNMGAIYKGMVRYWQEHDYKNPPGSGPNGALTQEDWRRVLEPYGKVWNNRYDSHGKRLSLFKCPNDHTSAPWSYEINPDLTPGPKPPSSWIIREIAGEGHRGYKGMLYIVQEGNFDKYYTIPYRPAP